MDCIHFWGGPLACAYNHLMQKCLPHQFCGILFSENGVTVEKYVTIAPPTYMVQPYMSVICGNVCSSVKKIPIVPLSRPPKNATSKSCAAFTITSGFQLIGHLAAESLPSACWMTVVGGAVDEKFESNTMMNSRVDSALDSKPSSLEGYEPGSENSPQYASIFSAVHWGYGVPLYVYTF